jgi:hypothetical protein
MKSDEEGQEMNEKELYDFLEKTLSESSAPAPLWVEERYRKMIRAQFSKAPLEMPGWRSTALLVACVSAVLRFRMAPGFSLLFGLTTVLCATLYALFIRFAARVTQGGRRPDLERPFATPPAVFLGPPPGP